jgi:mannosidase alpha-like ER degradation enhancer 2
MQVDEWMGDWRFRGLDLACTKSRLARALLVGMVWLSSFPAMGQGGVPVPVTDADKMRLAGEVREQCLRAWEGYKTYAWGHDELKPLTHTPYDWYGKSLLITPVDALDTLVLMGLTKQADEDRALIDSRLDFDQDIYVSNFETTIRLLGGLLSGYQETGDKRLLELADDLGGRLLPAFGSPTGMPYVYVNLHSGAVRGAQTNPAMVGSLLLEFGMLSRLTGKPVYYAKAKRALVELYKRSEPLGLVGSGIDVETGRWTNTIAGIQGGIDSYYEYLLKASILFDDADCARMWKRSVAAINKYLADERPDGLWYGQAEEASGVRTTTYYGALDAFFPAVLALGGDLERAKRLEDSSYGMWQMNGIEPDKFDYVTKAIQSAKYPLRPEIMESAYYLYVKTGDAKYVAMGRTFFEDLVKYCGTGDGFASLKDVRTKQKSDQMGSYLFAESFKYLYLLFSPASTLPFDSVIFNTEAHPMKRGIGLSRGVGAAR